MSIKVKINKLIEDPVNFINSVELDILIKIIVYCSKKYYNSESVITDELFDFLINYLKKVDPNNKVINNIGAKVLSKLKVQLPYFMGSMNKIKPTDENILNKWLNIYNYPFVISDKLDGVSALFINHNNKLNLYTRGDGIEGTDISSLIKFIPSLNNINISGNIAVRGELIINKKNFKKYKNEMSNARNMVSGIVNSKTINRNIVYDVDFVSYELINPWINNQIKQFQILKKYNFNVVPFTNTNNIDFLKLTSLLSTQKKNSNYEIDGIIISSNKLPDIRPTNINPPYAFAFKDLSLNNSVVVKVLNVKWAISKDGYIKPTLELQPTKLDGVIISNVTAFNAKYIIDNVLGTGSEIILIRSGDVIPHIVKVIKKSDNEKPQLPSIKYKWNENNVDIIAIEHTDEQLIKELTFFFKNLGIKNIDKMIVKKFIDNNIDSIQKILKIKISDLQNIDGFKDKLTNKIYNNILSKINDMSLLDLMVASNCFGHGIGKLKLKKILHNYPDILNQKNIDITDIDGFDVKTNDKFIIGLKKFNKLYKSIDNSIIDKLNNKLNNKLTESQENNKFKNMNIVFSGFRNKEWELLVENNNGIISNSITSKTTLLVISDEKVSNKIKKAKELNIKIINKDEFYNKYIK